MTVPEDFNLEPVKANDIPQAQPPRTLKPDIYSDSSVFKSIDDHAVAESKISYKTFRDLMWNLVFREDFGELEKARAIFRWLTVKDLSAIELKSDVPEIPERLLNDFKQGKGSYARAFEFMARYAGLSAVSIKGWAKGIDYSPGCHLTSEEANHSWNAVYINGSWQLVDSNWASYRKRGDAAVIGGDAASSTDCDDFYFLTNPAEMIYSHFPEDSAWQLLPREISAADFKRFPHLKSHFFNLGLQILQQNEGVMYTQNGVLTLTLGFTKPTAFTYKITHGNDKVEHLDDISLNKYVLQEMTEDRLTYYFRAPSTGKYHLTIFARGAKHGIPKGSILFKSVAEYKIICDEEVKGLGSFPYCSDSSWGSDVYIRQYPIIPSVKTAVLLCPSGKAELVFEKAPNLRLYARLVKDQLTFDELKSCLSFEEGKGQTVLRVNLKKPGEYGLEIFANDPAVDGEVFTHFSQHLVVVSDQEFVMIFGFVFDRKDLPENVWPRGSYIYLEPEQGSGSAVDGTDPSAAYDALDAAEISESAAAAALNAGKPGVERIYTTAISAQPPSSFEAVPVSSDKDAVTKRPSQTYKQEKLFDNFSIFKDVDRHSVDVSNVNHGDFRDLIWHLIYARNITDELEKARAIFVYLSSKDLSKISFDTVGRDTPEEMLMTLKDGRTTYARVFETLCSFSGLICETVTGYAKGADYQPGMHFSGDDGQHSWNAVYVNGTWQLVDCHWAARRLIGKQVAGDNVRYELDDYYFMPESGQLIFTHFPQVINWQLLENPITLDEFENLVPVKSAFFKNGLQIKSHRNAVIRTDDGGEVVVAIGYPKGRNIAFTFSLLHDEHNEGYAGVPFSQFALNYSADDVVYFKLRLPVTGVYHMVIYAKEQKAKQQNGGMFAGVCEYEVLVENAPAMALPYPNCAHTAWGPGDSFHDYNIIPEEKRAIIHTTRSEIDFRLKMKEELRFTGRLKSALVEDESQLVPFLIQRVVGDTAIFSVRAPMDGEFGLEVYANNPLVDGQNLHHIYQYLIIFDKVVSQEPYPSLPASYLGPQPQFKSLGLVVAGTLDPFVILDDGEFHMSFTMSQPTRMSCQLFFCSEIGDEDISDYTLQQSGDKVITYVMRLPRAGFYKAQFYALPSSDQSESLPGVYNCLINCRSTFVSSVPFPKQYGIWRDGCYLYEPLDGHLQPNRPSKGGASTYQHVFYSVDVPKATAVAVVVGEEWVQLEQKPGSSSWSGEVNMESFWGHERRLCLVASFDDPPSRFGTLLEYSM